MPRRGYIQSTEHREMRLKSIKNYISVHGNGWLGRKHRPESIKKMSRSKSTEHKSRIASSMMLYWSNKNKKEGWVIEPVAARKEPVAPQQYRDIFMPDNSFIADGDIWTMVGDDWTE